MNNMNTPSLAFDGLVHQLLLATLAAPQQSQGPGAPKIYCDELILILSVLVERLNFFLAESISHARQIMDEIGIKKALPSASTLCKRRQELDIAWRREKIRKGKRRLAVDSTGIKLTGSDGWRTSKVERPTKKKGQAGDLPPKPSKEKNSATLTPRERQNHDWLKLTLITDINSGEIVGASLAQGSANDAGPSTFHRAWDSLPSKETLLVDQVLADAAYDRRPVRGRVLERARRGCVFKPRVDARIRSEKDEIIKDRNQTLRLIKNLGWKEWGKQSGYSRRALVETTMSRLKGTFPQRMRARSLAAREVGVLIRVAWLNANL